MLGNPEVNAFYWEVETACKPSTPFTHSLACALSYASRVFLDNTSSVADRFLPLVSPCGDHLLLPVWGRMQKPHVSS